MSGADNNKRAKAAYIPQPGTIPARVVAYLHEQLSLGRQWVPSVELAEHVGQETVTPYLDTPVQRGCLIKRMVHGYRRRAEYALGDGQPLRKPADLEPDEPLHPVPKALAAAPLFPPAVPRQPKPGHPFHAGLFTDGALSIKVGDSMVELDAAQTITLARLLCGVSA